jgi:hypothetical protein
MGRLKSELAEVIIANFCYPSFFDYRLDTLRTRPVDRRKRQEVWAYISSLPFGPLSPQDANTIEFRRFVERVFLRYIEINRGLIGAISVRRVSVARSRVSQLATTLIKDLNDFLTVGDASTFGRAKSVSSWGTVQGKSEPTWEQIEHATQLLQTTLLYLHSNTGKEAGAGKEAGQAAEALSLRETPPPVVAAPKAVPTAPKHEQEETSAARISTMPTQMLSPRVAQRIGYPGAAPGSLSRPVLGSKGEEREYGTVPLDLSATVLPAPRRQFLPLSRPSSASRPIAPVSTPPAAPAHEQGFDIAGAETARYLSVSPAGGAAPLVGGTQPPEMGDAAGQVERMSPETGDAAWLRILSEVREEAAPEPARQEATASRDEAAAHGEATASHVDSAQALANGATSPVGPFGSDLPDLPESFAVPDLGHLPPDLAELYGDYLRDSRSGATASALPGPARAESSAASATEHASEGATSSEQEETRQVFQGETRQDFSQRGPATIHNLGVPLVLPEAAEVDAVITALAGHLAEEAEQPWQGAFQETPAPPAQASGVTTIHPWQAREPAAQGEHLPASAASAGSLPIGSLSADPLAAVQPVSPALPKEAPVLAESGGADGHRSGGHGIAPAGDTEQAAGLLQQDEPVQPPETAGERPGPLADGLSPLGLLSGHSTTAPLAPQITRELYGLSPNEQAEGRLDGQAAPQAVHADGQMDGHVNEQAIMQSSGHAATQADGQAVGYTGLSTEPEGTKGTSPAFSSLVAPEQLGREMTEADVLIFVQLQHQVSTWVKIAAVSHQIEITGQDIPGLVAELRHTAALEEAELQVIESLVALCQRVATTRQATMEDYKQAMMLYLLHHRSRLAL